jgi:L-lysine exporter family protein LysE/ArgO
VSLLNPHVYLDTVVLIGSIGARHPLPERLAFAGGAMAASIIWFVGLGYGAARLSPLFSRPSAWRALDILVGTVMWSIAASLIASA